MLAFLISSLIACGGGGSGGGSDKPQEIPNFQGTWDLTLETKQNECDSSLIGDKQSATYNIIQNGNNLTLVTDEDGSRSTGEIDGSDSFSSTETQQVDISLAPFDSGQSGQCTLEGEIRFDSLKGNQAEASINATLDCGAGKKCSIAIGPNTATRR